MKIQSISDVITNSSSEIFPIYRGGDFKAIKELVNELLKLAGSCKTFDDLFEIKIWATEDAEEEYSKSNSTLSLEEWCLGHDEDIDIEYENPYVESYTIIAKTEEAKEAAHKLTNLDNLFEYVETYR